MTERTNDLEIKVFSGDIERAIQHLRRITIKEKLFLELKRREGYEKPSTKRRRKARAARRRMLRREEKVQRVIGNS